MENTSSLPKPAARQLILASTSRYRRDLLARLGVPFECVAPACDEEQLKDASLAPLSLAETLAEAKAASLRPQFSSAAILASDQVAACNGRILNKPLTAQRAAEQLRWLAGREHELITAVCLTTPEQTRRHTDITRLRMRPLTDEEIGRYLAADEPYDCAGSYKLEQRGIALFESIRSDDHSAITGLPLMAVTTMLRECGFQVP
jgi:septum formation protein